MKKLTIALSITTMITLNQAAQLAHEELTDKAFCSQTNTGTSVWSFGLKASKQLINQTGVKAEYHAIGNNTIKYEMGQGLIALLKRVYPSDLTDKTIQCYEIQKIENKTNGKSVSLADSTLNDFTLISVGVFGMPTPTKKDIENKKAKEAQEKIDQQIKIENQKKLNDENARKEILDIAKQEELWAMEKQVEEERIENEKKVSEAKQIADKKRKLAIKERVENITKDWISFSNKLNIHKKISTFSVKSDPLSDNEIEELNNILDKIENHLPNFYTAGVGISKTTIQDRISKVLKSKNDMRKHMQLQLSNLTWWLDNKLEEYAEKEFGK